MGRFLRNLVIGTTLQSAFFLFVAGDQPWYVVAAFSICTGGGVAQVTVDQERRARARRKHRD